MFKVKKEKCDQCLFTEKRIVRKGRMREILSDCKQSDSHFICHKSSIEGGSDCCKGFYDTQDSQMIRIAQRFNAVEFVN